MSIGLRNQLSTWLTPVINAAGHDFGREYIPRGEKHAFLWKIVCSLNATNNNLRIWKGERIQRRIFTRYILHFSGPPCPLHVAGSVRTRCIFFLSLWSSFPLHLLLAPRRCTEHSRHTFSFALSPYYYHRPISRKINSWYLHWFNISCPFRKRIVPTSVATSRTAASIPSVDRES